MERLLAAIVATFLLGAGTAHAGIIYEWVDVDISPVAGPLEGRIEIKKEFWRKGATLEFRDDNPGVAAGPGTLFWDAVPFESFYFSVAGVPLHYFFPIRLFNGAVECSTFESRLYPDATGYCDEYGISPDTVVLPWGDGGPSVYEGISAAFSLTLGPFLQGSIEAISLFSSVGMAGTTLWTIDHLATDASGPCGYTGVCDGGSTGYWRLDRASVPVSEPSTLAVLAIGLIATGFARRRRHNA